MSVFCCRFVCDSVVGGRNHFFERGDAQLDLHQAGLAQVAHAFAPRLFAKSTAEPLAGSALDGLGDRHHLVDADPAR
jgi:hypothetical protein